MSQPESLNTLAGAIKLEDTISNLEDNDGGVPRPQKDSPISLNTLSQSYNLRQSLSEHVAKSLVRLFELNVIVTASLTCFLAVVDALFIYKGKITPDQRLISGNVFMTIVGATTVQLGLGIAAIVTALFKQPSSVVPDIDSEG